MSESAWPLFILSSSGEDRMARAVGRVLLDADARVCDKSVRNETSGFSDTMGRRRVALK